MNQPWIYMCSPSRSPLPPPSPSHPTGSSQCTSPEHLSHASNLGWFFFFLTLFIYGWARSSRRALGFPYCSEWVLLSNGSMQASYCSGFSCRRVPWSAGSGAVTHQPCFSTACGVFLDQGWMPWRLHWQANSSTLDHQGSPTTPDLNKCQVGVVDTNHMQTEECIKEINTLSKRTWDKQSIAKGNRFNMCVQGIVPEGFWGNDLFFPPLIFISWRLITLQYCSGFCHTLTWISHGFTCVPHPDPPSHLPLHPIPLDETGVHHTELCKPER